MAGIILAMLTAIFGGSFAGGVDDLKTDIASYNQSAFEFCTSLNSVAVKPVAATILAIILVLELARLSTRYEGDSKSGTQQIALALLKAALILIAIANVDLILSSINEAGEKITAGVVAQSPDTVAGGDLPASVKTAVDDLGLADKAGLMLVLFLPWLLSIVASIGVKIIVLLRFAEIYILSAAATLPLVFLSHPETKSIGVGYLRRYAGAVLHGVVIILCITIYSYFQVEMVDVNSLTGDNMLSTLTANLAGLIAGPVFFLTLLFGSSRMAKAFLGEG
ncbi:hypothetical protein [Actinotignum timonense]|uniref:hypothetical protein n=1 Tax=Actinotignum timonense TaxID=1870995 RepID=UPI0025506113|nr:hypothetical protein [Actinotignum timonense]